MNRSGLVGPQGTTEQPFLLGQKMDEKENASVDPVGQYINSARRGEPVDRLGPVGPRECLRATRLARSGYGR